MQQPLQIQNHVAQYQTRGRQKFLIGNLVVNRGVYRAHAHARMRAYARARACIRWIKLIQLPCSR